ncbi:MAG TPA: helix-turn-helix domain-containing protein [Pyrinomonadaceae bacterium]|nr:helix-turn-helix domain-containing protein [Pyrinomonadaceae bacterium]
MTLILSMANPQQVILISDRRLTSNGKSVDEESNKAATFILQKAYENAIQVDAFSKAGLAALTLIEEIHQLPAAMLQAAYDRAREWLSESEEKEILRRLNDAAGKFASSVRVREELSAEQATEALLSKPHALQQKMLETEREMIRHALAQANGRVTHAAALLGMTYQALTYIIESRHTELLKERTPIRR